MSDDDLQEPLQAFASMFDHVVRETVGEDFARQGRDGHAGALALEDVAEVFEVAVPPTDDGVAQFEGGNIGARVDLVGCVHVAGARAVGLWVLDLS